MVRSSKIEVFGMATVERGYNELERRCVIKTLPDAGVESTRELSERYLFIFIYYYYLGIPQQRD